MKRHRYVATAQAATAVGHCCVVGVRRESSSAAELKFVVVSKGTRLETYSSKMELSFARDVNGAVAILEAFRPSTEDRDLVFLVTEHRRCCVLRLETRGRVAHAWSTEMSAVSLDESRSRLCARSLAAVEGGRMPIAACLVYDGLVHVVNPAGGAGANTNANYEDGPSLRASSTTRALTTKKRKKQQLLFCARVSVVRALDVCFLPSTNPEEPVLAVLHDDGSQKRHVTTFVLSLRSRRAKAGPLEVRDLDATAHVLLPTHGHGHGPGGGPAAGAAGSSFKSTEPAAVVVGERELCSFDGLATKVTRVAVATAVQFTAKARCDRRKWFLADKRGRVHVVFFAGGGVEDRGGGSAARNAQTQSQSQSGGDKAAATGRKQPKLQTLGAVFEGVEASCLAYLGDRDLFVGSAVTDAKVATLGSTSVDDVRVVSANFGPVIASCVAEPKDVRGQGRFVACCGAGPEGTLRVVRQGVDVAPTGRSWPVVVNKAEDDGLRLRGAWCLPVSGGSFVLVATFVSGGGRIGQHTPTTRVFFLRNEGRPERRGALVQGRVNHDPQARTLHCAALSSTTTTKETTTTGKSKKKNTTGEEDEQAAANVVVVVVATTGVFFQGDDDDDDDVESSSVEWSWRAPGPVTVASSSATYVVVGGKGFLRVLDAAGAVAGTCVDSQDLEPSCAAVDDDGAVAMASWSSPRSLLIHQGHLPDERPRVEVVDGTIRSVAFLSSSSCASGSNCRHIALGLGDGVVLVYEVGTSAAVVRRRVSLGSTPARLFSGPRKGLFATSDRAATLRLSELGVPEIAVAHLRSSRGDWSGAVVAPAPAALLFGEANHSRRGDDEALLVASSSSSSSGSSSGSRELRLCSVERTRGVRASGVSLGEQPRCVCHDASSKLFCVGTAADDAAPTKGGCLRFLADDEPYDETKVLELDDFEEPLVATCVDLALPPRRKPRWTIDFGGEQDDDGGGGHQAGGLLGEETAKKRRLHDSDDDDDSRREKKRGGAKGNNDDDDDDDDDDDSDPAEAFVASLRRQKDSFGRGQPLRRPNPSVAPPSSSVILVGTAVPGPTDFEPKAGRILAFEGSTLRSSVDVAGAVYDVVVWDGKVAAAVNHAVLLFDAGLRKLACYEGFVVALKLAVAGPFLVVGDLMRSVTVLQLRRERKKENAGSDDDDPQKVIIEEVARDYDANWTTALADVSSLESSSSSSAAQAAQEISGLENSNEVLLGEGSHNLLALRWKRKGGTVETVACVHLGDLPSCFAAGSLATEVSGTAGVLFGCLSGRIGCVLPVAEDRRAILEDLQRLLVARTRFLGDLDYYEFRALKTEAKIDDLAAFLDGDLLETFLDMPRADQVAIVGELNNTHSASRQGLPMSDDDDVQDDQDDQDDAPIVSVDDLVAELGDLRQQH